MRGYVRRGIAVALFVFVAGCGDTVPSFDAMDASGSRDAGPVCIAGANTTGAPAVCPGAANNATLPSLFPPCSLANVPACRDARCVPTALLPANAEPSDLADCEGGGSAGKCVPDVFVATQGEFLLSRCTAAGGVEGRCLSPCLPAVAANLDTLATDVCQDGWRCSPCVDEHGVSTGACEQGCDTGASEGAACGPSDGGGVVDANVQPPASCCGGLGLCLDTDLVPTANRGQLAMLECTSHELCIPTVLASGTPATCRALGALDAEGRCLPACLPEIADDASTLDQGRCDPGYLCAPCFDPRTGAATGACSNNGDAPTEPPKTFPACCADAGRCVPPRSAGSNATTLTMRDCASGLLCAPAGAVVDPDGFSFPGCTIPAKTVMLFGFPITVRESPGACVPGCFMADRDRNLLRLLELLFPSGAGNPCDVGETCAPCTSPLDGMPTGACR